MTERTFTAADYPGINSEVERLITSYAVQACPMFTPSQHGNAHRREIAEKGSTINALCRDVEAYKDEILKQDRALTAERQKVTALRKHFEHLATFGDCATSARGVIQQIDSLFGLTAAQPSTGEPGT